MLQVLFWRSCTLLLKRKLYLKHKRWTWPIVHCSPTKVKANLHLISLKLTGAIFFHSFLCIMTYQENEQLMNINLNALILDKRLPWCSIESSKRN